MKSISSGDRANAGASDREVLHLAASVGHLTDKAFDDSSGYAASKKRLAAAGSRTSCRMHIWTWECEKPPGLA
jgi:hypothetical protein